MIAKMLMSSAWFWVITLGALIALIHRRSKVMRAIHKNFKLPAISSTSSEWVDTITIPQRHEHDLPDRPN